jgi:predicted transcriptional regulator
MPRFPVIGVRNAGTADRQISAAAVLMARKGSTFMWVTKSTAYTAVHRLMVQAVPIPKTAVIFTVTAMINVYTAVQVV